jgi:hypothetical protein
VRYDPATGSIKGQNGVFMFVKLVALAADGPVADDKTPPKATISGTVLRRHVAGKRSYFGGLRVKVNEPGQTVASIRLKGKVVGFGLASADTAGTLRLDFGSSAALRRAAAAHRRVLVHITVNDWAGNKRIYERAVRLAL